MRVRHQYTVEIRSEDGTPIGSRIVEPDWSPAVECARFEWWRHSPVTPPSQDLPVEVEPQPDPGRGLPATHGFRIVAGDQSASGNPAPVSFPVTWFEAEATSVASRMVEEGLMARGQLFRYRVYAFDQNPSARRTGGHLPAFAVGPVVESQPTLRPASLATRISGSRPEGKPLPASMPVFVPQRILDEVTALAEQSEGVETGGILIGHLLRDVSDPELALDVTAQIPARKAEGTANRLTFTAACWADVRAALALRCSDELMVGWWHSHPARAWCNPKCTPEQKRNCPLNTSFFSQDDIDLHETVFSRAYHAALVVTLASTGVEHALFGWHQGRVCRRGFNVPETTPVGAAAGAALAT